ncbi:hypothetical protein HRG84_24235 [Flavisolibacter sp. BT320]|nr:hypothetical protein [Flavisolibacter longurius]
MIFTFYPDIIPDVGESEIISGEIPFHFSSSEYLVVRNGDEKRAFKINYEHHCSPFKEAAIRENLLLVGHEEHFYLYDMAAKRNILVLKMEWYFGHLYFDEDFFYVADAQGLYKINGKGEIIWHNDNLGIDGVIIDKFTQNQIFGSGEWDPPGGWRGFVLDKKTGKSTTAYFG